MIVKVAAGMPAKNALSSSLGGELASRGFSVLRGVSRAHVVELSAILGHVVLETHVRIDPHRGTYLTSPEAIPPHNDHPAVDYISWHCQRQDPAGGEMLLVDMDALAPRLDPSWLQATMPCPCVKHLTPQTQHPVRDDRGWYFAEWHAKAAGLHGLVDAVGHAPREVVSLNPGDALFVDNRRMLHARGPITPGSPRHLVRRWIMLERPQEECHCMLRVLTTSHPRSVARSS